jgi:putative membrane protein
MHAFTLALLVVAAFWYAAGVRRLWQRAGQGRGITRMHVAAYACGMTVLAFAAFAPLGEQLWTHMIQHELLMVLAAPLVVLGRPMQAFAHVVPVRLPRLLSDPVVAFALHGAAILGWHVPLVFVAATANEGLHFAQHASFLASALVFWWMVFARRDLGALMGLFGTMLYTGALGALMTFSNKPWYAGAALADQTLAGLVMWIPAGLAYPAAAVYLGSRWLARSPA